MGTRRLGQASRSTGHGPVWTLRVCPPSGGDATGPNPTDRGKAGSKHHLIVDCQGVPLAITLSAANVHDSQMLEATVDAIAPIRRPRIGVAIATVPKPM